MAGSLPEDAPPPIPTEAERAGLQLAEDGVGPLVHRLYRVHIRGASLSCEELIARLGEDLDAVAPSEFATFQKVSGEEGRLAVDDELVVRMPGPWDGPVRVVASTPSFFRLATLEGHIEAGQIEFRARPVDGALEFVIEAWARSGDRLSDFVYNRLRMAKETQLHMWMSVLERTAELAGGRRDGGIVVTTRMVDPSGPRPLGGTHSSARAGRLLAELSRRGLNYDPARVGPNPGGAGWHVDEMVEPLPHEASGPPVEGGSWQLARGLMNDYQVADPRMVRAAYRPDSELSGRDMLLQIRFLGLRFHVGVRLGRPYDETRTVGGRQARVAGWDYKTLEGHFEQGQLNYEVWKWLDTGTVEFRLYAVSRVAESGPWLLRLGYRLVGRSRQVDFYRRACRRVRRMTESRLEAERTSRSLSPNEEQLVVEGR